MIYSQHTVNSDNDKERMINLASRFVDRNLHVVDLPYRLSSWALDDAQNTQLWFNDQQELVGWAVLQTPFWMVDYSIHANDETKLLPAMITWVDDRAKAIKDTPYGHDCWFFHSFTSHPHRIDVLEKAGFACQADVGECSWSKVLMQRPGNLAVQVYQPPIGFSVRPLKGLNEVEAYVNLHQTVFESKNMTLEWRKRTVEHKAHKADLDLVVEDPEGRLGAFCICWFDEETQIGHVEPLGCHPDYRSVALGRVALSHGLQRLVEAGAQKIMVETDDYRNTAFRLYEFFDFQVEEKIHIFRKNY